jgi:hypothetical protein
MRRGVLLRGCPAFVRAGAWGAERWLLVAVICRAASRFASSYVSEIGQPAGSKVRWFGFLGFGDDRHKLVSAAGVRSQHAQYQ